MSPDVIRESVRNAKDRLDLWSRLVKALAAKSLAEVGVYRGEFAQHILTNCPAIERYYMIDPWRHLGDWNKPLNRSDNEFAAIREEAIRRTEFASEKRVLLEGRTTEVSGEIPDGSLDFAYIDGDHTLRGITIDLVQMWPKMKEGGILAGDDFCSSIWQHDDRYEPTLIFPFAVHFAEAKGAAIYGLPFNQFAILVPNPNGGEFRFDDLTDTYRSTELRDALSQPRRSRLIGRLARKCRKLLR